MTGRPHSVAAGVLAASLLAVSGGRAQDPAIFAFNAGFWVNLHHFLYVLGRHHAGFPDRARRAVANAPDDEAAALAGVDGATTAAWRAAVTVYANGPSRLDAISDESLWQTTRALSAVNDDDPLPDGVAPEAVQRALVQAAPVYRRLWWPAHGRRSRDRIDDFRTMLRLDGAAVQASVSRAFGEIWPAAAVPVQVSAYANWAGAYSTGAQVLVLSSLDPGLAGTLGFEMLFHEALHQWDGPMFERLRAAARRRGVARVPGGLDHALVFYTAGEAVRRAIPPHVPYAELNGMWQRGPMARFKPALDAAWRPFLLGQGRLDEALDALIVAATR